MKACLMKVNYDPKYVNPNSSNNVNSNFNSKSTLSFSSSTGAISSTGALRQFDSMEARLKVCGTSEYKHIRIEGRIDWSMLIDVVLAILCS